MPFVSHWDHFLSHAKQHWPDDTEWKVSMLSLIIISVTAKVWFSPRWYSHAAAAAAAHPFRILLELTKKQPWEAERNMTLQLRPLSLIVISCNGVLCGLSSSPLSDEGDCGLHCPSFLYIIEWGQEIKPARGCRVPQHYLSQTSGNTHLPLWPIPI